MAIALTESRKLADQSQRTFLVPGLVTGNRDFAGKIQSVGNRLGLKVEIRSIENPRKEAEEHYYNPAHSGLIELGLKPHFMTEDVIAGMLERVIEHRDAIDVGRIMPRVRWSQARGAAAE